MAIQFNAVLCLVVQRKGMITNMKKIINIILCITIIMSLAVPCFAKGEDGTPVPYADEIVSAKLRCFPLLSVATRKTQYAYTYTLQMFLDGKKTKYQIILEQYGGIDGDYFTGTAKAVAAFQDDENITSDGICGSDTWEHVGLGMYDSIGSTYMVLSCGSYLLLRVPLSSPFDFYYNPPGAVYPNWTFLKRCTC